MNFRIGVRVLVTNVSPSKGDKCRVEARVWHIDIYSYCGTWLVDLAWDGWSVPEAARGGSIAQVSTTWVPVELITLIFWPCFRGTATPERAGMV